MSERGTNRMFLERIIKSKFEIRLLEDGSFQNKLRGDQ